MEIKRTRTRGEYYVYIYLDPRKLGTYVYGDYSFDYEPIYVGKGKRKRAYYFEDHNKFLKAKLAKFGKPIIKIIAQKLPETKSFELEIGLIALIGRKDQGKGPLCNLTDGGEGNGGRVWSEESKQKMRRPKSEEHKKKISESRKGRKQAKEHTAKIALANTGKTRSKEIRKKMSISQRGKVLSEEHCKQMSMSRKGRVRPRISILREYVTKHGLKRTRPCRKRAK